MLLLVSNLPIQMTGIRPVSLNTTPPSHILTIGFGANTEEKPGVELELGFLADIIAHPEDDGIRLIYADWLSEEGSENQLARSEFIRLQIANHRSSLSSGPVSDVNLARERELQDYFERDLLTQLSIATSYMRWKGGFLTEIHLDVRSLIEHADKLFQKHPIQYLRLYWGLATPIQRASDLKVLVGRHCLTNLLVLDLSDTSIGSPGVETLASAGHRLPGLIELNLTNCHVGDAGLRGIIQSSLITHLNHLNLRRNDISTRGVRQFIETIEQLNHSGIELRLRSLDLRENRFSQAGLVAIRNCSALRGIAITV